MRSNRKHDLPGAAGIVSDDVIALDHNEPRIGRLRAGHGASIRDLNTTGKPGGPAIFADDSTTGPRDLYCMIRLPTTARCSADAVCAG